MTVRAPTARVLSASTGTPAAPCPGFCRKAAARTGRRRRPGGLDAHWYPTNDHVVIDADTRLIVVVGQPLAWNRNDCKAWDESGAKTSVGKTLTIADGGYPGTGPVIPHRRQRGQIELPEWKEELHRSHKQIRARIEHVSPA